MNNKLEKLIEDAPTFVRDVYESLDDYDKYLVEVAVDNGSPSLIDALVDAELLS